MTTVPTQSRTMIALIDDDEQICLALRDWLELLEQPALYYLSAEALLADLIQGADGLCLRGAGKRHAPLRAAVIDLNLPGMNGIDLAKALRLKDPLLTLVLITAAAWEGQVQAEAGELGVACLRKPFMLEALEQALIAR